MDVEDWYQVCAFEDRVDFADWARYEQRVEIGAERILTLLAERNIHATFFTLGWVAQRYPNLIRRIVEQGHELASHGMRHTRVITQTPDEFRDDVTRAKGVLEEIGGVAITGYRASTWSMHPQTTPWAWNILAQSGHRYSSSLQPIRHDLYDAGDAARIPHHPITDGVVEIPVAVAQWAGRRWALGGGGWFRLLPYGVFARGLRYYHAQTGRPAVFYCHPWELDPEQPMLPGLSAKSRFRHRLNLKRMQPRLARLLDDFAWDRLDRVYADSIGSR
ncbi:putative polysaccharide deacetylase [Magnetofaba australis IT-1]|uniref:Putative polysaccharide deacetylase n=1 Tax=Magnetofaba australis IT-1 TaxID=1434232 RepID=A0A1Y2K7X1_9PROT|nr:putative polysaccharide deacetylase [Magnetofaba australis IT-1]